MSNNEQQHHQEINKNIRMMEQTTRPTYSSNTYNPHVIRQQQQQSTHMPTTVMPMTMIRRPNPQEQAAQQSQNMDPEQPKRCIFSASDMVRFKHSEAYQSLDKFICQLAHLITGKKLGDIKRKYASDMSEAMKQCLINLDQLEQWVSEYPPTAETNSASRYGNLAFRDWFDRMAQESDAMQKSVLEKSGIATNEMNASASWKFKELSAYWREGYGNRTRIDYGTGHEVSFCAYMYCLAKLGIVHTESDCMCLVGVLFPRYLEVMRKIQLTYKLEPAGSHGVWGLDDYSFLPFLFGGAQLEMNAEGIEPSSIHDERILADYSQDYMYLGAIEFIHKVKKGPFAEHSPVLNDISGVLTWKKVAHGMIKMYRAEVLDKFVVVQHFLFGKLLSFEPVDPHTTTPGNQLTQQS